MFIFFPIINIRKNTRNVIISITISVQKTAKIIQTACPACSLCASNDIKTYNYSLLTSNFTITGK